jgi:hypothetical protein
MRIGESLIVQGLATPQQVTAALELQKRDGGRLGNHLVAMGVLTVKELLAALRARADCEAVVGFCQRTVDRCGSTFGRDHYNTHRARYEYARALLIAGQVGEGATQAEAALIGVKTTLGLHHPWTQEASALVNTVREIPLEFEQSGQIPSR